MEKHKKIKNILYYIIETTVLFILINIIIYFVNTTTFYNFLGKYIVDIKLLGGYARNIVKELTIFSIVIIIVFIKKYKYGSNSSTKEKIVKATLRGWPLFLLVLLELLFVLYETIFINKSCNFYEIFGLLCYCLIIGLTEEFICRKWIQDELIAKYGDTHKKIILYIFVSSVLFGLMHLINLFYGQSFTSTLVQVIQNIFWGMAIGAIYYKTKNIWSVVLIHGITDFILKLDEVVPIQNYMWNFNPLYVQVLKVLLIIISIVIYILYTIKLLKQNHIKHNIKKKYNYIIMSLIAIYFILEIIFIILHIK